MSKLLEKYPPSVAGEVELFFKAQNHKHVLGLNHAKTNEVGMEWLAAAEFNSEMGLDEAVISAMADMMLKLKREN